jgi:dTDP-4-amino-4,6-dideoxygalactose transaminase
MNEHSVETLLADRFQRSHVLLTGNGTTALFVALCYARQTHGCTSAVYPEITCQTAVNAAVFAGLPCRFIDTAKVGFLADSAYWQRPDRDFRSQCLVLTDIFGYMHSEAELQGIDQFGFVIEDAAQAFFSENGVRHAGSLGCASILSFGPGKQVDVGSGGALLTDDGNLADFGRDMLAAQAREGVLAMSHRKEHYRQLLELEKQQLSRTEHVACWQAIYRGNRSLFLAGLDRGVSDRLLSELRMADSIQDKLLNIQNSVQESLHGYPVSLIPYVGRSQAWRVTFVLDSAAERNRLLSWLESGGIPVATLFQPASCLNSVGAAGHNAIYTHSRVINLDLKKLDLRQFKKVMNSYEWNR